MCLQVRQCIMADEHDQGDTKTPLPATDTVLGASDMHGVAGSIVSEGSGVAPTNGSQDSPAEHIHFGTLDQTAGNHEAVAEGVAAGHIHRQADHVETLELSAVRTVDIGRVCVRVCIRIMETAEGTVPRNDSLSPMNR